MDGGEEGAAVFRVARGDAAPAFEMKKGVFDQVARFVKVMIVVPWVFSVFLWRDDRAHTPNRRLSEQGIGVVSPVGYQMVGVDPIDQAARLCAIRAGTFRNKDSERQTSRIHGQMDLAVEPPWVRLMAWLPPRAPAACG